MLVVDNCKQYYACGCNETITPGVEVSTNAEDIVELIRLWNRTGNVVYEAQIKRIALNIIAAGVRDVRGGA